MVTTLLTANRKPGDVANKYGDLFLSPGAIITRGVVLLTEEQYMVATAYGWSRTGYDSNEKRIIAERRKRRPR